MRALESLIKKAGGWKRIQKMFEYSGLNSTTMNACIFVDGADLEEINDELGILNSEIAKAYEKCKGRGKPDMLSPVKLPLCVVIAAIHNSLHKCEEHKTKISSEEFLRRLRQTLYKLEKNPVAELFDLISVDSLNSTSFFFWSSSPEKNDVWSKIYRSCMYNDCNGLDEIELYDSFLKCHPECKEEIKEFCKQ